MSDVDRDLAESKILDLIEERDQCREVAVYFHALLKGEDSNPDLALAAYDRLCKEDNS